MPPFLSFLKDCFSGILPVDHMRDHYTPIQLLCNRVPRHYLEQLYSILLPKPADHEKNDRPPTAHELLTTLAFLKGYMSASGIPDCSRSARLIIKDAINGKVKWGVAPPGIEQKEFDDYPMNFVSDVQNVAESTLLKQVILF